MSRNVARGRRAREPVHRRTADALEPDEVLALLAAAQLDRLHKPETLRRAQRVHELRDRLRLRWKEIGAQLDLAPTTAIYLYGCVEDGEVATGPREAVIATRRLPACE